MRQHLFREIEIFSLNQMLKKKEQIMSEELSRAVKAKVNLEKEAMSKSSNIGHRQFFKKWVEKTVGLPVSFDECMARITGFKKSNLEINTLESFIDLAKKCANYCKFLGDKESMQLLIFSTVSRFTKRIRNKFSVSNSNLYARLSDILYDTKSVYTNQTKKQLEDIRPVFNELLDQIVADVKKKEAKGYSLGLIRLNESQHNVHKELINPVLTSAAKADIEPLIVKVTTRENGYKIFALGSDRYGVFRFKEIKDSNSAAALEKIITNEFDGKSSYITQKRIFNAAHSDIIDVLESTQSHIEHYGFDYRCHSEAEAERIQEEGHDLSNILESFFKYDTPTPLWNEEFKETPREICLSHGGGLYHLIGLFKGIKAGYLDDGKRNRGIYVSTENAGRDSHYARRPGRASAYFDKPASLHGVMGTQSLFAVDRNRSEAFIKRADLNNMKERTIEELDASKITSPTYQPTSKWA